MNLTGILDNHVAERGDKVALIQGERRLTYAQFDQQVGKTASLLASRGLGLGSRIALFVPMSIDLYVLLLGILRLGAIAVVVLLRAILR